MKKTLLYLFAITAFTACSTPPAKKVVVMASGKINAAGDVLTYEPGTQHNETSINLQGDKLTVKNGSDSKDYPVTEAGTWLLNLQKDTLIGSVQNYGESDSREGSITQEALMERMDSLRQLTLGTNVSAAKKNHFLEPGSLKKISAEDNAIIVGPFKGMPASLTPGKDGKTPEVYKFITNNDARETLGRLEKMLKQ